MSFFTESRTQACKLRLLTLKTSRSRCATIPTQQRTLHVAFSRGFHAAARRSSRKCIVTGGTSGIGYQVAKGLLSSGAAHVQVLSRDAHRARSAAERIASELNLGTITPRVTGRSQNFDERPGSDWLWSSAAKGRPFDTLVNGAGISQASALIATRPLAVEDILRVNLKAPIIFSQQMLKNYFAYGKHITNDPEAREDHLKSFNIVNISSLLALKGGYGTSVYASSKAGLIAFTRSLTLEAASIREKFPTLPPFRANVVVPGYIDTPMIQNFSAQQKATLEQQIPLRRYGTATEVADAVIFLINNEYANNTVLNLDGGLSAT